MAKHNSTAKSSLKLKKSTALKKLPNTYMTSPQYKKDLSIHREAGQLDEKLKGIRKYGKMRNAR